MKSKEYKLYLNDPMTASLDQVMRGMPNDCLARRQWFTLLDDRKRLSAVTTDDARVVLCQRCVTPKVCTFTRECAMDTVEWRSNDRVADLQDALKDARSVLRVADRSDAWKVERDRVVAAIERALERPLNVSRPDAIERLVKIAATALGKWSENVKFPVPGGSPYYVRQYEAERAEIDAYCKEVEALDGAPKMDVPSVEWADEDRALPEDLMIQSCHPAITTKPRHDLYAEAMRMVGAKRSKGALVELVHWLLYRIAEGEPDGAPEEHHP